MTSFDVYESRRSRQHFELRKSLPVPSLTDDSSDVLRYDSSSCEPQTRSSHSVIYTATDTSPGPSEKASTNDLVTTTDIGTTEANMVDSSYSSSPGRDQWLFDEEDLQHTPSIIRGGISMQEEWTRRAKGVNFIIQAGMILKLPQLTLATASVFFHRFYMRENMVVEKGGIHHYVSLLRKKTTS